MIADFFTEGRTLNEQLRSLKGKGKILLDEAYQINHDDLYKRY